ncbi:MULTISPECIES: hypothetical protein [Paracoccaceae]|nr:MULTISPECIES: hypothetical protein [Paracoccaceae]
MSERYVSIHGNVAILVYRVSAERSGDPICEALCTSIYLKDEGQSLRLTHQQTILG